MSDSVLFLCGLGVISLVLSAIALMVSTIYRMAERDEREMLVTEGIATTRRRAAQSTPSPSY